ncbi:MAG: flagellar biosynthetic protein FliR [Opitutaceae bacterium]|jgi:flagellar biosynthetic protein FliR
MLLWIIAWVLISLRSLGVIASLPTPGGGNIPVRIRVALSMILAVLLVGIVPLPAELARADWIRLAMAAISEVLVGFAMGLVVRAAFSITALGGRLIANEIGLNSPPGFDVPIPAQEPLPALVTAFAGVMFFGTGVHQDMLAAFARSFDFSPLGTYTLTAVALERMIKVTSNILAVGLRIAAPFIALSFIINLAFSILGKAVPRMNVFIASISVRLWGGLLLLSGFGALLLRNLDPLWQTLHLDMLQVSLRSVVP